MIIKGKIESVPVNQSLLVDNTLAIPCGTATAPFGLSPRTVYFDDMASFAHKVLFSGINKQNKKDLFGGSFIINNKTVRITKVIYNAPATIVFWSDDTKTTAKCDSKDTYSAETGLTMCVLKKFIGGDDFAKTLSDWLPTQGENVVTISSIRKKHKNDK